MSVALCSERVPVPSPAARSPFLRLPRQAKILQKFAEPQRGLNTKPWIEGPNRSEVTCDFRPVFIPLPHSYTRLCLFSVSLIWLHLSSCRLLVACVSFWRPFDLAFATAMDLSPSSLFGSATNLDTAIYSPPGASSTAPPKRGFRFLELSGELRNHIYDCSGFEDARRELDFVSLRSPGGQDGPALLRVNKQLAHEAGAHYFAHGHFDIATSMRDPKPFLNWLKVIGPVNRHRLASNANVTIRLVHYSERFDRNWNVGVFWSVITGAYHWPEQSSLPVDSRCPFSRWTFTCEGHTPISDHRYQRPTWANPAELSTFTDDDTVGLLWGDSRQLHLPALASFMVDVRTTIMAAEVEVC